MQLEKDKKAKEEADAATKAYQERLGKLASEIRKVSDNLAFNNDQQLESLALDTRLIGKKEDEIELARALSDVYKKEKDTIVRPEMKLLTLEVLTLEAHLVLKAVPHGTFDSVAIFPNFVAVGKIDLILLNP